VGTVPTSIPTNTSVNVPINFNPSSAGLKMCSVTIDTNGTPEAIQVVEASGTGTLAVINTATITPTYGAGNIVNVGSSEQHNVSVTATAASNLGVLRIMSATISPSTSTWITFAANQG
jgi:hypothetical protein